MGEFLLYIGRSSLYLAVFYAFFLLVMRRTSLFSFNRIVLLAGTAACFVLPLVRLRTEEAVAAGAAAAGPLTAVGVAAEPLQAAGPAAPALPLLLLYVAGAAAVLAFTGLSALRLARTIRSGRTTREDGYRLTLVDGGVHSFSWGRHIVMSRDDLESSPAILTHERMHVTKKHSLDIAFFSAVTVLHWFNPLVWITLSELKLLHEYEADEAVIQNGIDATQYQLLMVKKAVGEQRFSLANGFQHSKLKNRINMMIKPHTSGWMRLSYVAVLPVLAALMFACNPAREQEEPAPAPEQLETKAVQGIDAPKELIDILGTLESMDADKADLEVLRDLLRQYGELKGKDDADKDALRDIRFAFMKKSNEIAKNLKSDDYDVKAAVERGESVPFQLLEDKPTFNGGDANEFSKWVNANLKYPEAAKASGAQGRVTLQFTVGKDGTVGNVKILRGASEELDAEALRVISNSPKWEPGRIDGKPVPVTFTFPVVFMLK